MRRRAYGRQRCAHRDVDAAACTAIVRAHTVPKGLSLSHIAEAGHVMGHEAPRLGDAAATPFAVGRIGVHEASTFTGFCRVHDSAVFAPLEDAPFTATAEQLWLLQYRALCREHYGKIANLELFDQLIAWAHRELGPAERWAALAELQDLKRGTTTGEARLRRHKERFDREYKSAHWNDMRGLVVRFETPSPIMCSALVEMPYDFAGALIPDSRDTELREDVVSLDLFGAPPHGAAVLAWHATSALPGEALARSLLALPREEVPDALIRLVVEGTDNWYVRPSWWRGLDAAARGDLEARISCGTPVRWHTPTCLSSRTATYPLPAVVDIVPVNWKP